MFLLGALLSAFKVSHIGHRYQCVVYWAQICPVSFVFPILLTSEVNGSFEVQCLTWLVLNAYFAMSKVMLLHQLRRAPFIGYWGSVLGKYHVNILKYRKWLSYLECKCFMRFARTVLFLFSLPFLVVLSLFFFFCSSWLVDL